MPANTFGSSGLQDNSTQTRGSEVNPQVMQLPQRLRDATSRVLVSTHQNIYEADFEYGTQPLRWEALTNGTATIAAVSNSGGVQMTIGTSAGDTAIRQSRPYHRYQPGKTMKMATAANFGGAVANQRQRVGFFDDANGLFFEQADPTTSNPSGMFVVYRSDIGGLPVDTRITYENWSDPYGVKSQLNWNNIQMLWVEYAWYGAGSLRWGVTLNGEQYILHQVGQGNAGTTPWARTGNLPVRYELRNLSGTTAGATFYHYGVSVLVEGGINTQRGFTYSYGMALQTPQRTVASNTVRYPVLSVQPRVMGTQEFTQAGGAITAGTTTTATMSGTPFTAGALVGKYIYFPSLGSNGIVARITANTASTVTFVDNILGGAISSAVTSGINYTIGYINRGQLLPQSLIISSSALCVVELIASTPTSPVSLTGASFVALSSLGSVNSFTTRDVSATALSGGEVVYAFVGPAGGSGIQVFDLSNFFPLFNTIRGNLTDILTVAVTTPSGTSSLVGAHLICQEAMS